MNIYVSNLSFNVQDDTLKATFEKFGAVSSAKVIIDKMSNQSRGFGFVEMGNEDEAKAAIDGLNGTSIDNRELRVSEARPREEKPNNYNKRY
jgi:RNA recognition motif-containing protein